MKIASIDYGKRSIPVYRFSATPLRGVRPVPESAYTGSENRLVAVDVSVQVLGENFTAAYTEGDNRDVVATDSMKNFVLQKALEWNGATIEDLLAFIGGAFLDTYPQMEAVVMSGDEIPFEAELVPDGDGGFAASEVLFAHARGDYGGAQLAIERSERGPVIADHMCGRSELRLVKSTGSSFARFVRDEHTTLPEVEDRPLYIWLDVTWRYRDADDARGADSGRYVPSAQIRDICAAVFEEVNSRSIQELVYRMGERVLQRFPQLAQVGFEAQNRLWDRAFADPDEPLRMVRTDPRPPYGDIGLVLTPDDVPLGSPGHGHEHGGRESERGETDRSAPGRAAGAGRG